MRLIALTTIFLLLLSGCSNTEQVITIPPNYERYAGDYERFSGIKFASTVSSLTSDEYPAVTEEERYTYLINAQKWLYSNPEQCFKWYLKERSFSENYPVNLPLPENIKNNRVPEGGEYICNPEKERHGELTNREYLNDNFNEQLIRDKINLDEEYKKWSLAVAQLYAEIMEHEKQLSINVLEAKKSKCRVYGFRDNTDGMGLCLIELDKLEKLEEQTKEIQRKSALAYQQKQQALENQRKQRESQALINLGNAILGGGMPRSTTPSTPVPSYPSSYTSTLTIESNQLCPILSAPLVKQEVRGSNRICYYQ